MTPDKLVNRAMTSVRKALILNVAGLVLLTAGSLCPATP
jgi:hypothetical protein